MLQTFGSPNFADQEKVRQGWRDARRRRCIYLLQANQSGRPFDGLFPMQILSLQEYFDEGSQIEQGNHYACKSRCFLEPQNFHGWL
jgi:hypothetical protein